MDLIDAFAGHGSSPASPSTTAASSRLVVPRGVEYPLVHCGVPTRELRRPPHAPSPDATRLIMVSSFQPKKGHAVLVEALASSAALRSARLDLVGTGPLEPSDQEPRACSRTRGSGHLPRRPGRGRSPPDGRGLRRLWCSRASWPRMATWTGFPNTLIEAMALGIPVVTTSLSGIPELVIDGETGVVVRPGDPAALAAGLQTLIEDPEAARRRAAAGLAKVSAEFDIADSAAAMASLLERALSADTPESRRTACQVPFFGAPSSSGRGSRRISHDARRDLRGDPTEGPRPRANRRRRWRGWR